MASSTRTIKGREAYRAAKELEEARKAGTAAPAIDSEGKIINPHIPEYIAQAPWYVSKEEEGPSLKHQRVQESKKRRYDSLDAKQPRGKFVAEAVTYYRKGACENCGAMTHSKKDCLERPRRRGAKITGQNIKPDEAIGSVNLDFQGKRDRWHGFDEEDFLRVEKRFTKLEETRKRVKAERLDKKLRDGADTSDSDDEKEREGDGAVIQETGDQRKTTVRNLRIREDTAKYLYNLDVNSAYYDPKSRSMRADPRPDLKAEEKDFAGDNFVRYDGDVKKLAQMELFALEAQNMGKKLPMLQTEPSRAEAMFQEFTNRKKNAADKIKKEIENKYGGTEYSKKNPIMDGIQQSEAYVEYDREGKVLKGVKEVIPVSKYPEDVLEKNHTSIWGSYFKNGEWGYGCCHQTQRYSYCLGETGKKAAQETEEDMKKRTDAANARRNPKSLTEQWKEQQKEKEANRDPPEIEAQKERERLRKIEKEMRRQEVAEQVAVAEDKSKRYHSFRESERPDEITDEAMEAYRLRKQLRDDPMAEFLSKKS